MRDTVVHDDARTILIVDDDRALVAAIVRQVYRQYPTARVVSAMNGVRGLALAQEHAPDLRVILLDVKMPILDGRVLATELRRVAPRAVIIPFSGDMAAMLFFQSLGCDAPIQKPASPREIADRLILALSAEPPPLPGDLPWLAAMQEQARSLMQMASLSDGSAEADPNTIEVELPILTTVITLVRRSIGKLGEHHQSRDLYRSLRILEELAG